MRRPHIALLLAGLGLAACGGDSADDPVPSGHSGSGGGSGSAGGGAGNNASAGGAGQENQPPSWTDAPSTVVVREGETVRVPFAPTDRDGDSVQAKVIGGDGWSAQIEGGELVVLGRFDGADTSSMTIELNDGIGEPVQVVLPITVERRGWKPSLKLTSEGIEAREHPTLIPDEEGNRVLILGGSGYAPYGAPLGDLYEVSLVDGTVQVRMPQGDVPAAAGSRRAALVPGAREAYLFGGYFAQASSNELFRVDLSTADPTFKKLAQESAPPARGLHLFTYDPQTSKFFVFGGVDLAMFDDLYEGTLSGDTMVWKKLEPTGDKPSKRYGFFYAIDQEQGYALVYSGAQGLAQVNPARDLWKLDLRADPPCWSLLLEGDAVPEGRRNGAFAYDETRKLMYVWGGTPDAKATAPGLWVYDGRDGIGAWYELDRADAPTVRSSGAAFVDASGTVRFGFGNTAYAIFSDLTPFGF